MPRRPTLKAQWFSGGGEYMSLAGLVIHTALSLTALREYPKNRR